MNSKTINRAGKRIPTKADDESRAAAAEIAAAAREVAQMGKAGARDIDAALDDPDTIPMLTDILGDDEHEGDSVATSPEPASLPHAGGQATLATATEAEWNQMALQVEKNVMKSLTKNTDELVDGDLRDQLDEILDRGTERLLADIKITMQQAIQNAVAEAIASEMSKARHKASASTAKQEKNV
ncbi:MAG: hypothetical protein WA888_21675 [Burkholderiaceae bacterium]